MAMDLPTPHRFEDGPPMLLGGLRRRHAFEQAAEGMARQWREFLTMGALPGQLGATRYGVMCGADATGVEYMCGVEVTSLDDVPGGFGRMKVPAQHYAVFRHPSADTPLSATWWGILAWLEQGAWASAHLPDFERYPEGVDPTRPPAQLEIWVGVAPRTGGD